MIEPMVSRLRRHTDLRPTLDQAISDAVSLHGGEFGNIQLRMPDGSLVMVGHARLTREFLEVFARVAPDDETVCARAARTGRVVVVEDILRDPGFAPYLRQTSTSPFSAVLSAPIVAPNRAVVGVLSVHFAQRHRPTPIELHSIETYCAAVGSRLQALLEGQDLEDTAARLNAEMLSRMRE